MRKSEKEALQAMLDDEQETIKALEKAYQRALRRIDNHIRILESDEMTQSKIYQKRYQEAMKAQISAALDELHKKSNQTIEEYLTRSYQHGYVGTMYSLHKQGMPHPLRRLTSVPSPAPSARTASSAGGCTVNLAWICRS